MLLHKGVDYWSPAYQGLLVCQGYVLPKLNGGDSGLEADRADDARYYGIGMGTGGDGIETIYAVVDRGVWDVLGIEDGLKLGCVRVWCAGFEGFSCSP